MARLQHSKGLQSRQSKLTFGSCRPAKQKPKTPEQKHGDKPSVELDALPAKELRRLVADCIERHIDPYELERARVIESQERQALAAICENFVLVQN